MNRNFNEDSNNKFFRIRILSSTGDKISLKFPIEFVKRMIKINGFNWINFKSDLIDVDNVSQLIIHALNDNLTGNIVNVQTKNNDSIKINID